MNRSERRLLIDTAILGLALTFLVTFLDFAGLLSAPERFFYDFRARHCQRYRPAPTTQIVHIDVDDRSLEVMGRWPWPRSKLAEVIDELQVAGAKAVVLDVMLSEPAPYEITPEDVVGTEDLSADEASTRMPTTLPRTMPVPSTGPATQPSSRAAVVQVRTVNNDLMLADSIDKFGRGLVAASLNLNTPPSKEPIFVAMVEELTHRPGAKADEVIPLLEGRNFKRKDIEEALADKYTAARKEGMFVRIERECNGSMLSYAQLRTKIFPGVERQITSNVELRLLREQYDRYTAVESMRRFAIKIPDNFPKLIDTREDYPPLKALSDAAWSTGFVDFVRPTDGTVRFIPMFANHHGYAYPQLGLALACAMLDVEPRQLIVTRESVTIPCKPDPIVIPVHSQETYRGAYDAFIDIPWFGPPVDSGWQRMYDYPTHRNTTQHVPIHFVWEAAETRHRIINNNINADKALTELALKFDRKLQEKVLATKSVDPADPLSREEVTDELFKQMTDIGYLPFLEVTRFRDMNPEERELARAYRALKAIRQAQPGLLKNLHDRRAEVRQILQGKAAIVGYIAVGSIADVIPTSLHSQCPGVVAHGVIFNAIMTRDFWRRPPMWVTPLITAMMGVLVTAIVSILSPWKALAATVAVAAGYFVFNGYWVFDRHNLVVGVAGPVMAALTVWAGGTLARFMLEANLRAAVTRSFSMRVDPQLVSYVLERDPKVDGQLKELTVVFTDLAGFTTLSEQLKEQTVPLLNEYMGLMVPVIRKHRGYLNKFLGDGIMYFFGAPYENPNHAFDAVASVLDMQEVMEKFNRALTERGLPNLALRAGISSGDMVVGDAGSADSHDYTVLGDAVNLGARLEAVNKVFGTEILMNARARQLAGDKILFRSVGKIQVMGKREGVMTYEALALMAKASDEQRELASISNEIVMAFMGGNFEACLAAVKSLEEKVGETKLGGIYRRLSEQYVKEGKPEGFEGMIVMSEK